MKLLISLLVLISATAQAGTFHCEAEEFVRMTFSGKFNGQRLVSDLSVTIMDQYYTVGLTDILTFEINPEKGNLTLYTKSLYMNEFINLTIFRSRGYADTNFRGVTFDHAYTNCIFL